MKVERFARLATLEEQELATYRARTPSSQALYERALRSLPLGVGSSFQVARPYPLYLTSGAGSMVHDADGNDYVDYHNGFGSMVAGHAHPKISEAIARAARSGAHFAAPTEQMIVLAEELCRRFRMDSVRFCNSGTEATMDAIRLGRAASGKDVLLKVEGGYHGHHDAVMYSLRPTLDANEIGFGWDEPASRGIPAGLAELTWSVPFNNVAALEEVLDRGSGRIGVLILEPVMMNVGIIPPAPGYLQAVRELCSRHGVVLIFDEVKTGATIAPGGAVELYGVEPDLVCLAKAIGGGAPIGAFGGRSEVMDEIARGVSAQGTFNGNPLTVAASLATLTEVLTEPAYGHLRSLGTRLASGSQKVLEQVGIPAHTTDLGCKGSVTFRSMPLERYADYREVDGSLFDAYWYWMVNRGIFATPGKEEQWTISVQHSEDDIDKTVDVLAAYCEAVTA